MFNPFDPKSLLDSSAAAIFAKDGRSRMMLANPACLNLLGKDWDALHGRTDLEWHLDRIQARAVLANDAQVVESAEPRVYEEVFDTPLGTRTILSTKAPLLDESDRIVGLVGVAKDITELKTREQDAVLFRNETRHRLKNSLTLVQAIARKTLTPGDELDRFERRLLAYARSQDLLARGDGARLHELLTVQFASFNVQDRITMAGDDVVLTPSFATDLAIALHELATNSIKHGALSRDGSVSLAWKVTPREQGSLFDLVWQEDYDGHGTRPARQGFGYLVLTEIVPRRLKGRASLEFGSDTMYWRFQAQL